MNILALLIPATLILGGLGLAAFFWSLRTNQFDDPKGHAERILSDRYDRHPKGEGENERLTEGSPEEHATRRSPDRD